MKLTVCSFIKTPKDAAQLRRPRSVLGFLVELFAAKAQLGAITQECGSINRFVRTHAECVANQRFVSTFFGQVRFCFRLSGYTSGLLTKAGNATSFSPFEVSVAVDGGIGWQAQVTPNFCIGRFTIAVNGPFDLVEVLLIGHGGNSPKAVRVCRARRRLDGART